MPVLCPKCKAMLPDGITCQGLFDRMQQKELQNPEFYAVHYLSVPCYLLQHNQYSRDGWLESRKVLAKFVLDHWTPDMAREYLQKKSSSSRRQVSFTRSLRLLEVDRIEWKFSIGQVRDQHAGEYCEDVRIWAKSILVDTESLIRTLDTQG